MKARWDRETGPRQPCERCTLAANTLDRRVLVGQREQECGFMISEHSK